MVEEKETRSAKDLERVFVTQNTPSIHFDGPGKDYIHIAPFNEAWADEVLENSSFVERWLAENDNTILQLIPYVVCINPDGKILAYHRKGGGEGRLEGKKSIGIGGHVNIEDKPDHILDDDGKEIDTPNGWDIVMNGAAREISEELDADYLYVREHIKFAGTIYTPNDGEVKDDNPAPKVGEVHIGLIYTLEIPENIELKPDEGMINPHFVDKKPDDLANYEYWSLLVLKNINRILLI